MLTKKNKKGINAVGVSVVGMFVVVVLLASFFVYNSIQETALDEAQAKASAKASAEALAKQKAGEEAPVTIVGKLVSASLRAIDRTAGVETQVATTAYAWDSKDKKTMLLNGATTSATAGTDTTIKNILGGSTLEYTAFANATYLGGKLVGNKLLAQSIPISGEGKVVEADVYSIIATPLKITITEAGSETVLDTGDSCDNSLVNMTLSANQEDAIENLKMEVNASQKNFYLNSVVFDTPANSNINSIKVPDMTLSTENIVFLKDAQNYRFTPKDGAIFLKAYQSFSTGSIQVKAGGTDVVTEDVDVYFMDQQKYKATNGADSGEIAEGVENDKDTPEDIGHHYIDGCTQISIN